MPWYAASFLVEPEKPMPGIQMAAICMFLGCTVVKSSKCLSAFLQPVSAVLPGP